MRVLGIDASLRSTGLGVVESARGGFRAVEFSVVRNAPAFSHSACLKHIYEEISRVLNSARPAAAALEGGFYFKNARTALILGEVRGTVIAACSMAGVPVYEYSPRHVKMSLTGFGGASKEQVGRMVMSVLGLKEMPPTDAADALALAVCHAMDAGRVAVLRAAPL